MKWIIKDWADNHLFPEKEFNSFEDAWEFLYETFREEMEKDEEFFQDYYVETKETGKWLNYLYL